MLSRLTGRAGTFATPFWKTSQVEAPEVNASPMTNPVTGKPIGPSAPISGDNSQGTPNYSAGASPMDGLRAAFDAFKGKETALQGDQWSPMDSMQWPFGPLGAPSGAPESTASAGVPLPGARPAEAPQAPQDTSFFMRNALMQQDPLGGGFIDPTGAASVTGPDLISKMMGYLHRKV